MGYSELRRDGATAAQIQEYITAGDMSAITIRIPKNLRDSAKEAAALKGMSFSALVRKCLIEELSREA